MKLLVVMSVVMRMIAGGEQPKPSHNIEKKNNSQQKPRIQGSALALCHGDDSKRGALKEAHLMSFQLSIHHGLARSQLVGKSATIPSRDSLSVQKKKGNNSADLENFEDIPNKLRGETCSNMF